MDQTKKYRIKVASKKEFRQAKFILKALGFDTDKDYQDRHANLFFNGSASRLWQLTPYNSHTLELNGYYELSVSDLLEELVKVMPKPKKYIAPIVNKTEQSFDEQYKECAVRVKTSNQLMDVLITLGFTSWASISVYNQVIEHMKKENIGWNDLCISLQKEYKKRSFDDYDFKTEGGTQQEFRDKQYYIMEYNNFKRKEAAAGRN